MQEAQLILDRIHERNTALYTSLERDFRLGERLSTRSPKQDYPPLKASSFARCVAFTTALISVTRNFPSSSSIMPSTVQPAGVVTASFNSAGWSPVSRTT